MLLYRSAELRCSSWNFSMLSKLGSHCHSGDASVIAQLSQLICNPFPLSKLDVNAPH